MLRKLLHMFYLFSCDYKYNLWSRNNAKQGERSCVWGKTIQASHCVRQAPTTSSSEAFDQGGKPRIRWSWWNTVEMYVVASIFWSSFPLLGGCSCGGKEKAKEKRQVWECGSDGWASSSHEVCWVLHTSLHEARGWCPPSERRGEEVRGWVKEGEGQWVMEETSFCFGQEQRREFDICSRLERLRVCRCKVKAFINYLQLFRLGLKWTYSVIRSRLSSLADSCMKHRRSLSQSRRKSGSTSPVSRSRPSSPQVLPSSPAKSPCPQSLHQYLQFLGLPKGVIDIDDNDEDGMGEYGSEMFAYMRVREEEFVVEEDYLDQSSVSPEMRGVLVDWLLQVTSFCYRLVRLYNFQACDLRHYSLFSLSSKLTLFTLFSLMSSKLTLFTLFSIFETLFIFLSNSDIIYIN